MAADAEGVIELNSDTQIRGDNFKNAVGTLRNTATVTMQGAGYLFGGTFINAADGVVDLQSDANLDRINFRNDGLLRKSAGAGANFGLGL